MITLRGMAWDHPRGIDPLRAAADNFTPAHEEPVQIEWDARPLQQFEDTPIDELGRRYDLITIDHPLIGDACRPRPALLDLTSLVAENVLSDARRQSLGPSFASYHWDGHQYALPVDAAAQISAYRPDLLGLRPPRTWDELTALVTGLPNGRSIALAANPTHLYATWLSLCHQSAPDRALRPDGRPQWWSDDGVDSEVGQAALVALYRLLDLCSADSLSMDPIRLLDRMSSGDQIVYSPLVFGYCTYGRDTVRHRLRFAGPPSTDGRPVGTVLGGVGLAISARSQHPEAAARFLERVVAGSYQRTEYVINGGQPAHSDTWHDALANDLTNDFFRSTSDTVQRSFLRPRLAGYPAFQVNAGRLLHEAASHRTPPSDVLRTLTGAWHDRGRAGH